MYDGGIGSGPVEESPAITRRGSWAKPVLYPNVYAWYVLLASLDLMLTSAILEAGGYELNAVADGIYLRWGMGGMIVYKFLLVSVVVCICEFVGRRREPTGRRLAEWAVAISAIPVALALMQLIVRMHVLGP
jgi:hypothetical protein